ncbi:MAG: TolC family protein [Nitrospirae bacterium]|nr:MAG: TolC family protein [Nitrospirota bacterium]
MSRRLFSLARTLMGLVILAGLVWQPALADSPGPDTPLALQPLIEEALAQNPEILAAREQVKALQERIPQARALEDPELKISLWNTPESLDVTRSARTIYGVAQRFPVPGVLARQEEVAVLTADRAARRLAAKEREVTEAVKIAYFELFWAHKALEIHEERVELVKQLFAVAQAKFRVGQGTQVDVLKAQVELSTLLQQLSLLQQRKETARAHLNTLLNRSPLAPLGVPREPASHPTKLVFAQLEATALRERPELREAKLAVDQWEAATKLAKLRMFPKLRVELQRWQNFNTDDGFGGNVTLNIPFAFWTKSKYDARVREALARVRVARSKKALLENLTRFHIKDLLAQIHATDQLLELYTTTVLPQAQQTRKAALAGYRVGRTGFLDLIEADRAIVTYRLEFYRALVDRTQLLARLERVVGQPLDKGGRR